MLEFPFGPRYESGVRQVKVCCILIALLFVADAAQAITGRVVKVLPMYFDHKGRHMVSPSLYERDAYQAYLRSNPELKAGMLFSVQWKAKGRPRFPTARCVALR